MDFTQFKKQVIEYAKSVDIPKIGFTDTRPLTEYLDLLVARQKAGHRYGINEGDPLKRIDPSCHLPGAQSVISIGIPYLRKVHTPPEAGFFDGRARGEISVVSRGVDYHDLVMNKLRMLQDFIREHVPEARTLPMVDKEEILEKAFAAKAGLGWIGKNTLLITPEFGSFISLGELITDIPFPPDQPYPFSCHNCSRCKDACPTAALGEDHCLNPDLCVAGISQFKGNLDHSLMAAMGTSIYGCDICQMACPYNRKVDGQDCSPDEAYPVLEELLQMSNKGFKERFGHTAGAWRGRTVYQRNAVIAAGNLKCTDLVPVLKKLLLEDIRPVIRSAAAWALGRIGNGEPGGPPKGPENRKTE